MQIGTIPERLSALESGKVQAAMLNAPDNFRAQKRGLYNLMEVRLPYQGIGVGTTKHSLEKIRTLSDAMSNPRSKPSTASRPTGKRG